MYYLVYDPTDNSSIQIYLQPDSYSTLSTGWHYHATDKIADWSTCKNEIDGSIRFTPDKPYHIWRDRNRYLELICSEHPITALTHPELAI